MRLAQGAEAEVAVDRLGSQGDGIAIVEGEVVRIAQALPGERWQVRIIGRHRGGWTAEAVAPLHLAARQAPFCRHFSVCGGCRLQHLPAADYAEHKRRRIVDALARRGLTAVTVLPPLLSPLGSRRRLRLAWSRSGGQVVLGLRRRRDREIVDLVVCPVTRPALVAEIAPLRQLLATLRRLGRDGEVSLTSTATGLDIGIAPLLPVAPDIALLQALAAFAGERDLARLCLGAQPIVVRREPAVALHGTMVALPPKGFLQATEEGERALSEQVGAAVRPGDRVADLFAGLGGLGLAALVAGARSVHALEAAAETVVALAAAAPPQLAAERRDLARRPLGAAELDRLDLVILDPPRAGAAEQVRELAGSRLERLVYAACDPESFARDAAVLVGAGFALEAVQPVDQFVGSAEVELAATFTRQRRRGRA